ncbi:MAG: phytochelatin synthase family protein [Proteobacteria bacterium]|nr:phytochelatin synthase family protein [Pseudomonadota bacterium]
MKNKILFLIVCALCIGCASKSTIAQATQEQKTVLVTFSSDEGMKRMRESTYAADFFLLANFFESQDNGIVCGPTTAAIVLNALNIKDLRDKNFVVSKDTSSINNAEKKYIPSDFDPFLNSYTQSNVFDASYVSKESNKTIKHRSEVYGKSSNGKSDFGFQIRQFDALLKAHNLKSTLRVVVDDMDVDVIRNEIINNLATPGDVVIVNYKRSAMGQAGGGHISPLGAYHGPSDSVLIMDVNPAKADWVWIKMADLVTAMRTMDTVENRGYLLVSKQ